VKEWTRKPNRILSDDEVREILSLRESEMAGALARKYGVRRSTISSIWKGRTHREITANVEAYKA
jgi:DNA-binding XRE family transcriptional regulator